jgi:Bacterial putative lipoprotein (DUF940).
VRPYNQAHLTLQLTPWLETTLRYTAVTNRSYGGIAIKYGNYQHYKDRSADFKIRLLQEGHYWPALAFGIQDVGGTGLFSSEYFVGSYHWYDLDFSAGLAWGRLGSEGGIPNPFGLFGSHFRNARSQTRSGSTAGGVGLGRLFTGRDIGPFGGVQWRTPLSGLFLKLEYDGNSYQHEALGNVFPKDSPVNVGLDYTGLSGLDLGVGYERGNTISAHVGISLNFNRYFGPAKVFDPPLPAVPKPASPAPQKASAPAPSAPSDSSTSRQSPTAPPAATAPATTSADDAVLDVPKLTLQVRQALAQQHFELSALDYNPYGGILTVWVQRALYRNPAQFVGRVARALSASTPPAVRHFTIIDVQNSAEMFRVHVDRADFERAALGMESPGRFAAQTTIAGPGDGYDNAEVVNDSRYPAFSWNTGPGFRQSIGGPSEFYAFQVWWRLFGHLQLTDRLSVSGSVGVNLYNNFDNLKYPSNSVLPHVRSDIASYLRDGQNSLVQLETDYVWSPASDWYARMSAGIFEIMYGGVSGQVLYRPYGQRWALGVDINHVWKRTFTQRFQFFGYNVTTGYLALYYQLPWWHVLAKVSGGRYLARDYGATLDLSREFADGVRAGLFVTKTNISAQQFGEGSFDKGVYLSIPLDLFTVQSTRSRGLFAFRPLTRDGGQLPADGPDLYEMTRGNSPQDFARGWDSLLQ